jgi:hypothetical protein
MTPTGKDDGYSIFRSRAYQSAVMHLLESKLQLVMKIPCSGLNLKTLKFYGIIQ